MLRLTGTFPRLAHDSKKLMFYLPNLQQSGGLGFLLFLMSKFVLRSGPLIHRRKTPLLCPLAQEILVRLTDGQTIKAIASALGTTRDGIDARVRTMYRRFRVRGVAQLVHAAIREGWIADPATARMDTQGIFVRV